MHLYVCSKNLFGLDCGTITCELEIGLHLLAKLCDYSQSYLLWWKDSSHFMQCLCAAFTQVVMVVMSSLVQKCPYKTYDHKYVRGCFCASDLCYRFWLRNEASHCHAGFHTQIQLVYCPFLYTW